MPTDTSTKQTAEVFISFSPADEKYMRRLKTHLDASVDKDSIRIRHIKSIEPGEDREREVNRFADTAHLILLLVSADFLASECRSEHVRRARERHEAGEAAVIPIIIRTCDWEPHFHSFPVLPEGDRGVKPVESWRQKDKAYTSIAMQIGSIIEKHFKVGDSPATRQDKQERLSHLSYLCNRKEQENALKKILAAKNAKPRRPLVCIIHGNEDEGRDMYQWRLENRSLPQLLHSELPVRHYLLPLPRRWHTAEEKFNELRGDLAERVADNNEASNEKVAEALSKHRSPVIIRSYFREESWEPHGPELLEKFLDYWNKFPDLPPTSHLIICLFVTYLKTYTTHDRAEAETAGQQGARNPRAYLKNLDFNRYSNVHGVVLPELMPVSLSDAEEFFNDERYFNGICKVHSHEFCNVQGAIEEIRSSYKVDDKGYPVPLPMQYLAKELERILKKNRC